LERVKLIFQRTSFRPYQWVCMRGSVATAST
jgi:hypothetical protein